jgi:hypothetical protein
VLRLPTSTLRFKKKEACEFLKQHRGLERFLGNYLVNQGSNPGISRIEVTSLKYPYREFAWLFAHIIGLESITFVPRNIICVLHFSLHEKAIIDLGYLISSEVSFQLGNLKKT